MNRFLIPLVIFVVLVVFLAVGLNRDPKLVPSPLIDKPAPEFSLPRLHHPEQRIGKQDMLGKVWILNVWASWCVSCRAEHQVVKRLAATGAVEIVGLDYKDQRADALRWLETLGNPYTATAVDGKGDVGIDFGVYGVPESFLIDKQGVIRYKQIGPLTDQAVAEKVLPLVKKLQAEG